MSAGQSRIARIGRRLHAMPAPQRRTLAACFLLLPLVWLRLRLTGLGACQAWLAGTRPVARQYPLSDAEIGELAALVELAARHSPWPAGCLTRSLLLARLLRRRGVATDLRVGVRRSPDALEAHAWLERDGVPINDVPEVALQFAALR
jgi:hypothetical protein